MTNTNEQEVWKICPEYPWIEASNLGRVRTRDRYVSNGKNSKRLVKGHVLKQWLSNSGYMYVQFGVDGKLFHLFVHRIVAITFIPNPDDLPEVNHIDNDPTNNRLKNLEWCTSSYNRQYVEKYGKALGRPVIAVNLETCEVLWFESQSEAARQLGINGSHITDVVRGKLNKTHGFWFCNADENAVENVRARFGADIAREVEKMMNCN